jgi:hypothetical protein
LRILPQECEQDFVAQSAINALTVGVVRIADVCCGRRWRGLLKNIWKRSGKKIGCWQVWYEYLRQNEYTNIANLNNINKITIFAANSR